MTAMTFESINVSPRRVAVRRNRSASHSIVRNVTEIVTAPVAVAIPASSAAKKSRNRLALGAAFGLTLALHAVVISVINHPAEIASLPRKVPQLAIDIAPPPPPPPPPQIVQPKPIPHVAAVKPVARPVAPSTPVVQNVTETNTPSADTVQVATAPTPPAPPAPVAEPAAPAPEPEKITEARGYAGYLNNPAPTYPPAAQLRKLQGRVVLKVHVLASGKPDDISVAKSSGYDILDDSAIKTVKGWEFEPAKRGQKPIDSSVTVPINFKLS